MLEQTSTRRELNLQRGALKPRGFTQESDRIRDDVYTVNCPHNATHSVRVPPFNTGKVLIGARYQAPFKLTYSRQEERLQRALLSDPEELRQQRLDRWLYAMAVVALFVVIVTA